MVVALMLQLVTLICIIDIVAIFTLIIISIVKKKWVWTATLLLILSIVIAISINYNKFLIETHKRMSRTEKVNIEELLNDFTEQTVSRISKEKWKLPL